MSDRPLLFISAVSAEHRSLRTTIAALLDHEGYDTDFQEVLGTEHGDISEMLARHVDRCAGLIQLVGQRYGFAPPEPHPEFGECSYTQFEALYARSIGKPVRYLLLDPEHPSDALTLDLPPESSEQQALQAAYRLRVEKDTALWHPSTSIAETKSRIDELRPVLEELRREWRERMDRPEREQRRPWRLPVIAGVTLGVLICASIYFWQKEHQPVPTMSARLDSLERKLAELFKAKWADRIPFSHFPREVIMAELARMEGITLLELQRLLAEANVGLDVSTCAQALLIDQKFQEAAAISLEAGDAKTAGIQDLQAPSTLNEEAALDYRRAGVAHFYLLHFTTAIAAYETALEQVTRSSHPDTWAMLQNDLALALHWHGIHSSSPTGDQRLARAVSTYRAALEVRTRGARPQQWAATQNDLAAAICDQGLRSEAQAGMELLEQAVSSYCAALEVFNRKSLPKEWATTQTNLALTLRNLGRRSEGQARISLLDRAVSAYRAVLEVRTRKAQPHEWAMTQNNLGDTLLEQAVKVPAGEERERLYRESKAAYVAALEVFTKDVSPLYQTLVEKNLRNLIITTVKLE